MKCLILFTLLFSLEVNARNFTLDFCKKFTILKATRAKGKISAIRFESPEIYGKIQGKHPIVLYFKNIRARAFDNAILNYQCKKLPAINFEGLSHYKLFHERVLTAISGNLTVRMDIKNTNLPSNKYPSIYAIVPDSLELIR